MSHFVFPIIPDAMVSPLLLCSGERFLSSTVRQLTTVQPAAQLPDLLLQGLSAHLAAHPDKFSAQHAALCRVFPSLNSNPVSSSSRAGGSPEARDLGEQPPVLDTMAEKANGRSLVTLMEELGFEATVALSTVCAVLSQVTLRESSPPTGSLNSGSTPKPAPPSSGILSRVLFDPNKRCSPTRLLLPNRIW